MISEEGSDHADPQMKPLALLRTEVSGHPSTVRKGLPDLQFHSSTEMYLCLSCLLRTGLANCQGSKTR